MGEEDSGRALEAELAALIFHCDSQIGLRCLAIAHFFRIAVVETQRRL
jgi:hypothetical protein